MIILVAMISLGIAIIGLLGSLVGKNQMIIIQDGKVKEQTSKGEIHILSDDTRWCDNIKWLGLSFIFWPIGFIGLAKSRIVKREWKIATVIVLALYIISFAISIAGTSKMNTHEDVARKREDNNKKAIQSLEDDLKEIYAEIERKNNMPRRLSKVDAITQSKGWAGEFETYMREVTNQSIELRNAYFAELEKVRWNSILDPVRVKGDLGLAESRVIIDRSKKIVDKYEEKSINLFRDIKTRISSLSIRGPRKEAMLEGFDGNLSSALTRMKTVWELERKTVLEIEKLIYFLDEKRDAWEQQVGQFAFYNDGDMNTFNSHMEILQEFALQRQEINELHRKRLEKFFELGK